jgi:RNA recognition motif-containing protein
MLTVCLRIVEYATREQAQNAVNTLSNQNLMGRLVYVREVSFFLHFNTSEKNLFTKTNFTLKQFSRNNLTSSINFIGP